MKTARLSLQILAKNLVILIVSSVVIFVVTRIIPRSPMEVFLQRQGLPVTEENIANVRHDWGLDRPLIVQYSEWITGLIHQDWGHSIISGEPVASQMLSKIPLSLTIGLGGVILAAIIAYPLGILAAIHGGIWEWVTRILAIISQAIPSFVIGIIVISILGVGLGWVPFFSLQPPVQLIAPSLIIALYSCGQLARVVATHTHELIEQPFVQASLGRGFDLSWVIWHQGKRSILYGLCAALVSKMAWVIGGSAIVEFVFAVPGMSFFVISAIQDRDYPILQSYLIFLVVWMVIAHIVFDAIMHYLDPRARLAM